MHAEQEPAREAVLEITADAVAVARRTMLEANLLQTPAQSQSPLDVLRAARIMSLSQDDLYFLQQDTSFHKPINTRNEAAAMSILYDHPGRHGQSRGFQQLFDKCCIQYAANQRPSPPGTATKTSSQETLAKWAECRGIETSLQAMLFDGTIGGLAGESDLLAGSVAVRVPEALLISHRTAKESNLGPVLTQFPQLTDDTIAVIWTMVERHDEESLWAPFWCSLPPALHSALTMSDSLVQALQGTPAYAEIATSRQHVRQQYEEVKPILDALVAAYPSYMQPDWFTLEAYLWAVQLWYAYAMQVKIPDGSCQDCLVPFASLLNHSPYPHIVQYGRLDPVSRMLDFPVFRPLSKGQQCFLSYGPLPNLKLVLFYGMCVVDNPLDVVPVQLQATSSAHSEVAQQSQLAVHDLTMQHKIGPGQLPVALLEAATVLGSPDLQPVRPGSSIDLACSQARQAQRTTLHPVLERLKNAIEKSIAECQKLQMLKPSEAMLDPVHMLLSGHKRIIVSALQQLQQNRQ